MNDMILLPCVNYVLVGSIETLVSAQESPSGYPPPRRDFRVGGLPLGPGITANTYVEYKIDVSAVVRTAGQRAKGDAMSESTRKPDG